MNAYQEIARWRANIERLATFAEVMDATERDFATPRIEVVTGRASELRLSDLRLEAPDGSPVVAGPSARGSVR